MNAIKTNFNFYINFKRLQSCLYMSTKSSEEKIFNRPKPIPLGNDADRRRIEDSIREFEKVASSNPDKPHRDAPTEQLEGFPDGENPKTGEFNGPKGPEPTRFGDWERNGRVYDF